MSSLPASAPAPRPMHPLWTLTLLAILYLSLYPFSGWVLHRPGVLSWLEAGLPRYYSYGDLLVNVLAYLAFGAITLRRLQRRMPLALAVVLATLTGVLLSFCMESLQSFLPRRVPSLLDLIANSSGALLGALMAAAFRLSPMLESLRQRVFHLLPGAESERTHKWVALVLLGLWLVGQMAPQQLLLVNAPLRPWPGSSLLPTAFSSFQVNGLWLTVTGQLLVAASVALMGLLVLRCVEKRWQQLALILCLLGLGIAIRISSSLRVYGTDPHDWLGWIPWIGILLGMTLLHGLVRLSPYCQRVVGLTLILLCLTLALLIMPDADFEAAIRNRPTLAMRRSTPGFRSLMRALSACWPLLLVYFFLTEPSNSSGKDPRSAACINRRTSSPRQ